MVLVIGSLGVGLGVTLWLSTDAAERSYQLSHARETNQALLQQKEALERQVLEAQAAPALAEAARNLGMIPTRDTAHLVQDPSGNWVVVGTPEPAQGVAPPPLNTPLPEEGPPPPPRPRRASWSRARSPSACRPVLRWHPLRCRGSSLRRQGHRQRRWQFRRVPRSRTPPRDRRPRWARRLCQPHHLPMRRQHPSSRPRKCPLCRLTQVRRRRPRPWPRHFPAPPHEPR